MTIERKSRNQVAGTSVADVDRFIESDFLIRSGLCPNGHGLMSEDDRGQQCGACGFTCNTKSERGVAQ